MVRGKNLETFGRLTKIEIHIHVHLTLII